MRASILAVVSTFYRDRYGLFQRIVRTVCIARVADADHDATRHGNLRRGCYRNLDGNGD